MNMYLAKSLLPIGKLLRYQTTEYFFLRQYSQCCVGLKKYLRCSNKDFYRNKVQCKFLFNKHSCLINIFLSLRFGKQRTSHGLTIKTILESIFKFLYFFIPKEVIEYLLCTEPCRKPNNFIRIRKGHQSQNLTLQQSDLYLYVYLK